MMTRQATIMMCAMMMCGDGGSPPGRTGDC